MKLMYVIEVHLKDDGSDNHHIGFLGKGDNIFSKQALYMDYKFANKYTNYKKAVKIARDIVHRRYTKLDSDYVDKIEFCKVVEVEQVSYWQAVTPQLVDKEIRI